MDRRAFELEIDLPFGEAKSRLVGAFERAYLRYLIGMHRGNLSAASRHAGLSRRHLRELLRKHGLYRAQ